MRFLWSRVECEAAVGSNVRSVPNAPEELEAKIHEGPVEVSAEQFT